MTDGRARPDQAGPGDLGPGDLGPGDLGPGEPTGGLSGDGPLGDGLPGDDLAPEALAALLDEFFGDDDEDDPGPLGRPAPEADGPPTDTAARPPAGWAAAHAVGYDDAAGLAPALGPCEPRPRVRHAATADRPGDGADRGADGGPPFEPPQWGEGPGWDDARRRGHPLYVAMTVAQGAAELRSYLVRGLAEGEVSVDQPLFRPYRAGFGALADRWATEWRSLRPGPAPGWARLGPSAPGAAALSSAEAALAEVAGWGRDGDPAGGREAVRARVSAVRGAHGWAGAGPLGRAVVDQYALALVHRDAALMGLASATAATPRAQGADGPHRTAPASEEAGADALSQMVRAFEAEVRGGPGPSEADRAVRSWRRRADRAEVGQKNAARLVRHARRAGLLP